MKSTFIVERSPGLADAFEVCPKSGIRDSDAIAVVDIDGIPRKCAKHTERHGDPMIALGNHTSRKDRLPRGNNKSIWKLFDGCTDRPQVAHHCRNAVALLDPELRRVANLEAHARARSDTREKRKLIYHRGDPIPADLPVAQNRRSDDQRGDCIARDGLAIDNLDVAPHLDDCLDKTDARGVHAYLRNTDFAVRLKNAERNHVCR